jgi:glycerophosphoryl diester phosphodiesterase
MQPLPLPLPKTLTVVLMLATVTLLTPESGRRAFNVAHRGASAYAPEHTIEAYRLAIEQGADYVEQDLGITKNGVLVCSHDPSLERVTNVEELFPDRFTETKVGDTTVKRWFIEDFTLAEIKRLDAGAWFDPKFTGMKVATFQEAIDFIKGKAGFFPELKTPGRVRAKGFDMEKAVADILRTNGLVGATVKGRPAVHLQVFEEDSLRRLAALVPDVPRSFLMGTPDLAKRWLSPEGLKEIRTFATGVAPAKAIIDRDPQIVVRAHEAGLTVVPYTFQLRPKTNLYSATSPETRKALADEYGSFPDTRPALTDEMRKFVDVYKVDGLFTDNPDLFPR